ncbi:hypothetical protein PAPYR_8855 [Paratrimastix pyriformis]|uniref:Ubiquitin-like domain-containing protein n=1 Tax=Paratrimastix pyriformis TaxID=342808 RepID=A0ABQ8UFA6_9EUKA|nr:hypothetical protein PAPYR_8855 [Paratrimastix pyriformis]
MIRVRVDLLPTSVALGRPFIVEYDVKPTDTVLDLKRRVVDDHFTMYKDEDPTCAETAVFIVRFCNWENERTLASGPFSVELSNGDLIEFDFEESSREAELKELKKNRAPSD